MDTVCSDRCQPCPVESCGRWVGPGPGAVEEMTEGSTGALGAALALLPLLAGGSMIL